MGLTSSGSFTGSLRATKDQGVSMKRSSLSFDSIRYFLPAYSTTHERASSLGCVCVGVGALVSRYRSAPATSLLFFSPSLLTQPL